MIIKCFSFPVFFITSLLPLKSDPSFFLPSSLQNCYFHVSCPNRFTSTCPYMIPTTFLPIGMLVHEMYPNIFPSIVSYHITASLLLRVTQYGFIVFKRASIGTIGYLASTQAVPGLKEAHGSVMYGVCHDSNHN